MKQKTLLQLVPPHTEADYLEHFQSLAEVNMEIRQNGLTPERLLRKSIIELEIGNYSAERDAARDAAELKPDWAEVHYQEGMSLLLLALTKAGVVAGAPGMEAPVGGVRTLMEHAARSFGQALRLNADDEEVQEDVAALTRFLARHDEDADLEAAVRELSVT